MDLDPFEPVGIGAPTMRFIDLFLLHCLLSESPNDTPAEIAALARNQQRVAAHGRQPGLTLERGEHEVTLVEWGAQILDQIEPLAAAMDAAHGGHAYRDTLAAARQGLDHSDRLPSARVLAAMHQDFDDSYPRFIRAMSLNTREYLRGLPWPADAQARFAAMARASIEGQQRIEAADSMEFEAYRQTYLSPERLGLAT
jgi:glutamate--cysteine ligase